MHRSLLWAKEEKQRTIAHRRRLHQIPELHNELPQTVGYLCAALREAAIPFWMTKNGGIVARVSAQEEGATLAIRADMDALPIREETGLPFASDNGNMHACGHDAHAAMLLSVLQILSGKKEAWRGHLVGIFQPAEETTGGAREMIEEGALEKEQVDAVIALHIGSIFPEVPGGCFGFKRGAVMSSVDSFQAELTGKGGHGAKPHECVDPVIAMSEMILSLQQIVSRGVNPVHGAVITVGLAQAGTAVNIIPDRAHFGATVRTQDPQERRFVEKRIREVIAGVAAATGVQAKLEYEHYYPVTVNDEQMNEFVRRQAMKLYSPGQIVDILSPSMGTEDFSYFAQARPACFFLLGSRKASGDGRYYPHHNAKFDIDEEDLEKGVALLLQCALHFHESYSAE